MLLKVRGVCVAVFSTMCAILVGGCTIQDGDTKRQLSAASLIATPPSHYSTPKARYLGEKYHGKLDRLIEMIIANPKTSKLQFANNLGSSGGMGFFTHSAVKATDERFLEVVLGTGENLEAGEYSVKVARLFSLYGRELLIILTSDLEIYNDRELSGYGLNFTWRAMGSRMSTERAIVYFPKDKVKAYLRQDIGENTLLAEAIIFVIEPEGQASLLSFRPQEPAPDVRAPIQEQVLSPAPTKARPDVKPVLARRPVNSREGIKPATNAKESSAGEEKRERSASESETAPKEITPTSTLVTKEEIVSDIIIAPVVGDKTEAVGTASARESGSKSVKSIMPITSAVETTEPASPALEFPQPQVEGKALQSKLQLENKEGNTSELSSLVEIRKAKDQNELHPKMAGSQTPDPVGESRADEASKPDSEIHALPALGSIQIQSWSPNQAQAGSEVDELGEIASIARIQPKLARTETAAPAPITPSELQSGGADTIEQQPVVAHEKRTENIPEIKSLVKPMPKALEGYIIQVPFKDRSEARTWADIFDRRGYAVSMTEAGGGESLRVRIGNFRLRDDAERQLKSIREDGLTGIILNLPQAYRREIHSSLP
jgi:hypothetical protein